MSRVLTFRRAAVKEAADAFKWYEKQRPGLGHEFVHELEATIHRIANNPELPRIFYRQARKVRLQRFPYLVVYMLSREKIAVVAVFHCSRNPRILRWRLD